MEIPQQKKRFHSRPNRNQIDNEDSVQAPICKRFNSDEGCRFGSNCIFQHDLAEVKGKKKTMGEEVIQVNELDIRKLLKDIELLGSSRMTWKEKKALENKKVVSLGGKPPKQHRIPLSVARVTMKKQKGKEQKLLQEEMLLGRSGGRVASSSNKVVDKRKTEDKVLRASEGYFSKGVLDVKHLLQHDKIRDNESNTRKMGAGKKKKGGKKKGQTKGKKGGRKRH
ncbi:hypothetical protein IFM89_021492 [Coptis chinensis]|uniref:C3H1-type domain-containing protein n=1 Tax=Coptis chinensis TaxID=261450 RepID=A0A835HAB1_9MAGN|nr:hypothetical protein IFM89_021492 [Coptis chinensis]